MQQTTQSYPMTNGDRVEIDLGCGPEGARVDEVRTDYVRLVMDDGRVINTQPERVIR